MNETNFTNKVLNAIQYVVDIKEVKRPVHLHEPYFNDTNSWKYVKD